MLTRRHAQVIEGLKNFGHEVTARELAALLFHGKEIPGRSRNYVRLRLYELIESGFVYEAKPRRCIISGRRAQTFTLKHKGWLV
jgi:hypothetical protein